MKNISYPKAVQPFTERLENRTLLSITGLHAEVQYLATSATVGAGRVQYVNFRDADGTTARMTYTGGGSAVVSWSGSNLTASSAGKGLLVAGSGLVVTSIVGAGGANTVLSLTARNTKHPIPVNLVNIGSNIKAINMPGAAIQGNLVTPRGSARRITIDGASNSTITNGGGRGSTVVQLVFKSLGPMFNTNLSCDAAQSVTAPSWTADYAGGTTTGSLLSSFIAADLGTMRVTGDLTNFEMQIQDTLGRPKTKISVGGMLSGDYFLLATGLASLSAARMIDTSIVCDMSLPGGQFPSTSAQFYAPASIIGSISLSGPGGPNFANSYLVARNIGSLQLSRVQMSNSGQAFGVAAETIAAITGRTSDGKKAFAARHVNSPADWNSQKARVRIDFQDFAVDMLSAG